MEPEELTFQEIKEITDGFAQELGRGSFGVVYKGLTKTGKDVAVKLLLNHINIDYKQFHNEFNSLAMLQHPNIVQLLGYCYETKRKPMKYNGRQLIVEETHRVLCLEYLHNGSLRKYLSDVAEDFIIGRTDEKKKIIDSLIEAMTEKIIILPIYGIGGIGKTTFARLIYNDANFRFYSQVWVHVSPIFDLKKIGDSIISQLPEKQRQTKKNLIVLDDLWEDNPFLLEDLKVMLNLGDSINTIVLVTTCSEHVAEKICTNIKPYKIKHLTNDMCWEIIKQRSAFETRDDKKYLTSIGKDIALKCGGVALAAQSVGFMLRSMKSSQWMEVKNNNIWKESISDDASLQNQVLASLKLTYSYMDSCLKPCFTYCAMFPKGQKIHKDDLIQQWISLGFIKPTEIHSIMELCEKYVVQLLGLSFLQHSMSAPTYEGAYREKQDTLFTMHDLVHDLAVLLLGDEIMDQRQQGNTLSSSCRYALVTDSSKPLELCLSSCARLTALRFIDCRRTELCGSAFAPANFLRVLDLRECHIQKLPESIGQLQQLSYLKAPEIQDQLIPDCITQLSKLNYLYISGSEISALPESIGEMAGHVHLDISFCSEIEQLPLSFRNLENLVHLDLSHCSLITGVSESLGSLRRLQHLDLRWCTSIGEELPGALGSLTELQYLNLSHCSYLDVPDAEVLGNLNKLKYLNLSSAASPLRRLPESLGSFTELEYLNLSGCRQLEELPASFGKLCSLTKATRELQILSGSHEQAHRTTLFKFIKFGVFLWKPVNEDPTVLEISSLENVKSVEEAKTVKLLEKRMIYDLKFEWTRDAKRFVEDIEVLTELVPPCNVQSFFLQGYNSLTFPSWMMGITSYLPQLSYVSLKELPWCSALPPLDEESGGHLQTQSDKAVDQHLREKIQRLTKLVIQHVIRDAKPSRMSMRCTEAEGRHLVKRKKAPYDAGHITVESSATNPWEMQPAVAIARLPECEHAYNLVGEPGGVRTW
ncbi:unnamed protein product [Miscanthus lutarioriparius]|uniref:Protein kinase domain-containing protein n=1 Tax=Miscanthus lutarioriparius TaxID=422564 RepID=A0A811QMP6_9POAL|nr:unnamed protein product [Miscanthus lutarioriparius]